jgi:hypothetical protein
VPRLAIVLALIALPLLAETPSRREYVSDPTVAAGPQSYVVAWAQGEIVPYLTAIDIRLYGSDLSPRQRTSVRISNEGWTPHAVWNGTDYLLAWGIPVYHFDSSPEPAIATIHVREDGSVVPDSQRTFFPQTNAVRINGMACNGSRYAFVAAGQLVITDGDGALLSARSISGVTDVAPSGDGFRILIATDGNVAVADVDAGGNERGRQILAATSGSVTGRIATDHGETAVVWSDSTGVFGAELETGSRYTLYTAPATPRSLTRLANGGWLATWDSRIPPNTGCSATFSGGRMTPECAAATSDHPSPFAAGNLIVFVDDANDSDRLIGGSRSGPYFVISEVAAAQQTPSAAGTHIAWSEQDDPTQHWRVRLDGAVVSPSDVDQTEPQLAAAGDQTLLVWKENNEIRAMRNGSAPVLDLGSGTDPSIASNGTEWFVVWTQNHQIVATTVTASGDVLSPGGTRILPDNSAQWYPHVAWSGAGWLIGFAQDIHLAGATYELVVAQLVDRGANRIAMYDQLVNRREEYFGNSIEQPITVTSPAVGCNASECVVAWHDEGALPHGMRAALFSPAGARISDIHDYVIGDAPLAIQPRADGSFAIFAVRRRSLPPSALERTIVTAALDPVATTTLLPDVLEVSIAGNRIVYSRFTAPEEEYGSVPRVFYVDLPPPRNRLARHE